MNKLHRLLLAGTIISGVVSLHEAEAGVANSDRTKREGELTPWSVELGRIELAQAAEPEKPGAAPPNPPPAAPATPPPAAPATHAPKTAPPAQPPADSAL